MWFMPPGLGIVVGKAGARQVYTHKLAVYARDSREAMVYPYIYERGAN